MKENKKELLRKCTVAPENTIAEAVKTLDRSGLGILLVCDQHRRLLGVITDGDIRRSILRSIPFSDQCIDIANKDFTAAQESISPTDALRIMDNSKKFYVNHLPLLDSRGRVVNLLLRRGLVGDVKLPLQAFIMAGGLGKRLRPLTDDMPKPMLQVGKKPILEHIVDQIRNAGIENIRISTNYLRKKITGYFGNGEKFGVNIEYVNEDQPMGTAGSIGLVDPPTDPLLVINGDILTGVNFRAMFDFHIEHKADMTVGIRKYEFQVPYGVIECNGHSICGLREKPQHQFFINAGIYLIQPSMYAHIPTDRHYDMTDLVRNLLGQGKTVISFPIIEYWVDIGMPEDFKKANNEYREVFHTK
ncbi:nucleotidyltransferase family protein [Desulfonema magnum]|uniref:Nucleotidyl transferase domain-containing protein n=1 Tax=Desulfonema magnum TaxID=45655 RepID=A0A975BYH1_9BACT|nr:nucleotidyltransferase family protein [Desulfonema magnum]QTA93607.1 Nucleotidyl transferase domain-containing protein [Desulfonema magnum]